MIRALLNALKAVIFSVFIASVLVTIAILTAVIIVIYGLRMALWPGKRGVGDILFERLFQQLRD